eukprot:CAMPEP_0184657316 /NCGR_PEP_ID=MMETSP0308-20130426/18819_1 /TAXON_ID=38269 /ORGANISM="Gloeochaete witrockiana, Strain SAG 46.84" /LENGTH=217 /DNA_ID=CAMNT_0027095025 /DNA_START=120 /DNA_END=770 /DNA_ORIENTATION=+
MRLLALPLRKSLSDWKSIQFLLLITVIGVIDGAATNSPSAFPIGTILPFAGTAAQVPSGWVLCDGRIIDVISQPQLYNLAVFLGKTYDAQKINYRLPDLRGRTLFGPGGNGFTLGQYVGTPSTTIQTRNLPPHSHSGTTSSASAMYYSLYDMYDHYTEDFSCPTCTNAIRRDTPGNAIYGRYDANFPLSAHTHRFSTSSVGNGEPVSNITPGVVVNF